MATFMAAPRPGGTANNAAILTFRLRFLGSAKPLNVVAYVLQFIMTLYVKKGRLFRLLGVYSFPVVVSNQYFVYYSLIHEVLLNIFVIVKLVLVKRWTVVGGSGRWLRWACAVCSTVCSGREVMHSVVCWLETQRAAPRHAAPRSLTFASTAFTRFRYSARLSTSPPLLVPSSMSPSVSSTGRWCTFTFSFSLFRTTALTNYTSLNYQISPTRGSAPGKASSNRPIWVEIFEKRWPLGNYCLRRKYLKIRLPLGTYCLKMKIRPSCVVRQLLKNHWTYCQNWDGRRNGTRQTVSSFF